MSLGDNAGVVSFLVFFFSPRILVDCLIFLFPVASQKEIFLEEDTTTKLFVLMWFISTFIDEA